MPARKRRHDLRDAAAADARADAQLTGLHEAATRAARLHDWLDASRPLAPLGDLTVVEAVAAKPRRRLWPFGRKEPTPAERFQAILAELKSSVDDRPSAAERARDRAPAGSAVPLSARRAAG